MPHASAFALLRGNQAIKPFQVYLDCLVAEDMHFNSYVDHREMRPFDDIVLYSGCLASGSSLTFPHLPDHVMRQFDYTHIIPIRPIVSYPLAMTHRDMDVMFDDYLSHLIPEEAQSTIAESNWSYVDEYIRWFFRVSHSYMVQYAPGDPSRPAHQEILEEEQTHLNCANDVFRRCHRIVEIAQTNVDIYIFLDGFEARELLDAIMTEARETLMYQRHRRRMEAEEAGEPEEL